MLSAIVEWLENHMLPCHYKQFLGISCPMCGFQRALIELLKGNLWESMVIFPALIPLIITLFLGVIFLIFKAKRLKKVVLTFLIVDLAIMVLTSLYNNLIA